MANSLSTKSSTCSFKSIGMENDKGFKVFINNLHYSVDTRLLYDTFAQYGKILHAIVIPDESKTKNRGFGFVTYKQKSEADKAINKPPKIYGRECFVRIAHPNTKNRKNKNKNNINRNKKDIIATFNKSDGIYHKLNQYDQTIIFCSRYPNDSWNQIMKFYHNAFNNILVNLYIGGNISIDYFVTRPLNLRLLRNINK